MADDSVCAWYEGGVEAEAAKDGSGEALGAFARERRSILPRERWWIDLVTAERKVSEVGPSSAKAPCKPSEARKVSTGMRISAMRN